MLLIAETHPDYIDPAIVVAICTIQGLALIISAIHSGRKKRKQAQRRPRCFIG